MSAEDLPNQVPSLGRVLVVDDEQALVRALCARLQEHGYTASGFTSGAKALAALREQEFEVLLTDLMMPGMDGHAVLKASLGIDPHLVGVMMTGQGTVEGAVEAMKQGACDYVLKPFKLAELLPVLAKALELRRLRLENINLRQTLGLYELTTTLRFTQDLNTILDKTAEVALQQLGADEVSIMLPTQGGKELFVAAVRGGQREHLLDRRVPYGEGIAGWVTRHRKLLALEGPVQAGRFGEHQPRADIGASLSLPMLAAGQLVGVLNLNEKNRRRSFTPGEIKALQLLTSIAAEALAASRADEQAREAESQYRAIFDHAVVGIFQTTPEGRFLKANQAQARMLGYDSPEELIAAVSDVGSQVYVSGERREEFVRRLENGGKVQGFEIEARRRDGSTLWVLMSARVLHDAEGAVCGYEGMAEDITARKRQELEEQVLSRMREQVWEMQQPEDIAKVLEQMKNGLLAVGVPFQACGINIVGKGDVPKVYSYEMNADGEWCPSEEKEEVPHLVQIWRAGAPAYRRDLEQEDLYGERDAIAQTFGSLRRSVLDVPFSHGTLAINSEKPDAFSGKDIAFLEKLTRGLSDGFRRLDDLKTLKETQQQLYRSQKLEALGRLAGGMAHDFNNLITVIDGYSLLALKRLPREEGLLRSAIEEVQRAGERAAALVRQLLAFSRRQASERRPLDLNQLVAGVEKMLGRLIGEDVEMRLELDQDAGSVEADPGQLEQVLVNLAVNARDAMPQGGQLTIATAVCQLDEMAASGLGLEAGGRYCRLAVRDTGVGMSPEVQQHVFEPFFTTKKAGEGTGLGLATVYGIVKSHQGGIQMQSRQGEGTCFEIYLPCGAAGVQKEAARPQAAVPCGTETVLLVEDDDEVRQLVRSVLGELGYTVLEAGSAYAALQACGSHLGRIDLLLTDVVLPDVNGGELAVQVGVLHPERSVLYMSGYVGRKGLPQGAEVHFLAKPFTPEGLARAVRQALDSAPPK